MFFTFFALLIGASSGGSPDGPETVFNDAGYIRVGEAKELFYWVFESRNDPKKDPLVVWLSGGPGCSSLLALFEENGPYQVSSSTELELNPFSWNANATVVWVDQPAGTGYSLGEGVHDEETVGADMLTFMTEFVSRYKYSDLPLYVFGESYAGHYVPVVSRALLDSTTGFNLRGFGIGNGLTVPSEQYKYYRPFAEAHDLVSSPSLLLMKGIEKACLPLARSCDGLEDDALLDWTDCLNAYVVCNAGLITPVQLTGVNVYDVRRKCGSNPLCYDFSGVDAYLNLPDVKKALGVKKPWSECNHFVDLTMVYGGDWMRSFGDDVTALLENGVQGLVYAGEWDYMCNWLGNRAWTHDLDTWSGHDAYNAAENKTFVTKEGNVVGTYLSASNLTFLKVQGAGHLAPHDQPETTLAMLQRFIAGGSWDEYEEEASLLQPKDGTITI